MNIFGNSYRILLFGESHNSAVGVTIDGCPPGIKISQDLFRDDLIRRQQHYQGITARKEEDLPKIISGVFNGYTTGMPITILFDNKDVISKDYDGIKYFPRPSHSDFVAYKKYKGFNDYRGGGAFSGRLTLGIVAAGALAKKIISPIEINSKVLKVHNNTNIEQELKNALSKNDSVGGIIETTIKNVPVGLGSPFFDSVESKISHIIFSIPGVKGIEFGSGFDITKLYGSEANDEIIDELGTTKTNHSGGINGGISNGNEIIFRVAIKPTPSIQQVQNTIDIRNGKSSKIKITGRHDVCFAMRTPVIIEAASSIVLADFILS